MNGGEFDPLRIAATYADKRNWGRMNDPSYGCRWYWKGPVICAYELASWVKKEPDTRQLERDVIEAARGVIFGWYKSEFDPSKKCPDVNLEDAVIALDRAKGKEGKE